MSFKLDLEQDPVSRAPLDPPLTVSPETSVTEVWSLLRRERRGSVLVCREGRLEGIFTERDLVKLLARGGDGAKQVREVMTTDVVTVELGASVAQAVRKMAAGGFRRLPVVDADGVPSAVLKVTGIIRYLVDYVPEAVYNLPPRPNPRTERREGP